MKILIRLLVNAAALWVTAAILPGLSIEDGIGNLLLVALIFGAINAFIKPIAKLLTLPIRMVTLGLFTIVINAFMVLLTTWITDLIELDGGFLEQFLTALAAALIISIVSMVLNFVIPDGD